MGATVEEALAAVRAEAAVGEEVDESDGESDSSSEEDRLFFEEIIEDEKKEHAAPLLDEKYKEALEAGMTPQQIEDKLLPMLEEFKPKINQMMAETGQDKKTVVKTLIGQKYQELESSVGITWESLGATVEEALAAVRAEAAVGEDDGESDSSSEEERLLIEEIIEDEKKEHAAPLLDEKYKEALEAGMSPQQIEDKLLPMLEEFNPKINQMMAETGQDKKTVVKTLVAENYQELESSVGITWESLRATAEEAVAAVRFEAAVGLTDGEKKAMSEDDESAEDLALI